MGCKSPLGNPHMTKYNHIEPIAKDKGASARMGLEEVSGKGVSRRTEMSYKAQFPGKLAQDNKAQWIRKQGK